LIDLHRFCHRPLHGCNNLCLQLPVHKLFCNNMSTTRANCWLDPITTFHVSA
jgi:hypothetical protein